jgi:hypothetical protein
MNLRPVKNNKLFAQKIVVGNEECWRGKEV